MPIAHCVDPYSRITVSYSINSKDMTQDRVWVHQYRVYYVVTHRLHNNQSINWQTSYVSPLLFKLI